MTKFPPPEIYESFYRITSWGLLMQKLIELITDNAPKNANVLDLMCGTGYFLNNISKKRNDLHCEGVDLNSEFIEYAQAKKIEYESSAAFKIGNVLKWESDKKYDIIVCSGGTHHLRGENKNIFFNKIIGHLDEKGTAIIADPYIADYTDEMERKLASAELGYEYIKYAIKRHASDKELEAVINILYNDIFDYEHKTSINKILKIVRQHFNSIDTTKVWGMDNIEMGDYYLVCKKALKP